MTTLKKLISVWLLTVGFSVLLYGANPEKPISLQINNLTRWKHSPEAPATQQSLRAIFKARENYPRAIEPFKGAKQYVSVFKKPFLLLDAESNGFGGFFALVVFKGYPKVFSLWIYEIDKNIFEVREAVPLKVTLNKVIMNELADHQIDPFWLKAL